MIVLFMWCKWCKEKIAKMTKYCWALLVEIPMKHSQTVLKKLGCKLLIQRESVK